MSQKALALDDEDISIIRDMLLIGLDAFGELMRLENAVEIQKICGNAVHESLIPLSVSADAAEVSRFAHALRLLGA